MSSQEDEYFARENAEKLRKLHREQIKKLTQAQKDELKKQHANRCPSCGMEMQPLPYKGIKLMRCFECNGVFLEHEEARKLHEHAEREDHKIVQAVLNWIRHG